MNREELFYSIALTRVPGIGNTIARSLIDLTGSAGELFRNRAGLRKRFPDLSPRITELLNHPQALRNAEKELEFAEANRIGCLCISDPHYPDRLRECPDAPVVLFYRGNADLNAKQVISMVGTRKISPYGREVCQQFVSDLKARCPEILIVSGLAYGTDIQAHRQALANHLKTIGVLAHGLDRIYPSAHRTTADEMVKTGGLLTEFGSGTKPEKYNFVKRNRIIAGMSDAVVVVESAAKGGSLITTEIAQSYHRDCFAFPGRVTDEFSRGTNLLVRDHKASLILSADDLLTHMGWETGEKTTGAPRNPALLFSGLSSEELLLVNLLSERGETQLNTLAVVADMAVHKLQGILFGLEMKGIIQVLAGGVYRLA